MGRGSGGVRGRGGWDWWGVVGSDGGRGAMDGGGGHGRGLGCETPVASLSRLLSVW